MEKFSNCCFLSINNKTTELTAYKRGFYELMRYYITINEYSDEEGVFNQIKDRTQNEYESYYDSRVDSWDRLTFPDFPLGFDSGNEFKQFLEIYVLPSQYSRLF